MAKQGMKHYYHDHEEKDVPAIPVISGKAKSGKKPAPPLIAGTRSGKVYHSVPHESSAKLPLMSSAIDNDLALENMQDHFDMTAADLQDFGRRTT